VALPEARLDLDGRARGGDRKASWRCTSS
jgi:hypothetical protein